MDIPRIWRLQAQRYRLEGTKCTQCGSLFFPPQQICRNCKSRELQTYAFAGRGKIYTYSVVYNAPLQFKEYVPYIVALIDLDEGPRITAQIVDTGPPTCVTEEQKANDFNIEIGSKVKCVFRKISEDGKSGTIHYGYKFKLNP